MVEYDTKQDFIQWAVSGQKPEASPASRATLQQSARGLTRKRSSVCEAQLTGQRQEHTLTDCALSSVKRKPQELTQGHRAAVKLSVKTGLGLPTRQEMSAANRKGTKLSTQQLSSNHTNCDTWWPKTTSLQSMGSGPGNNG